MTARLSNCSMHKIWFTSTNTSQSNAIINNNNSQFMAKNSYKLITIYKTRRNMKKEESIRHIEHVTIHAWSSDTPRWIGIQNQETAIIQWIYPALWPWRWLRSAQTFFIFSQLDLFCCKQRFADMLSVSGWFGETKDLIHNRSLAPCHYTGKSYNENHNSETSKICPKWTKTPNTLML